MNRQEIDALSNRIIGAAIEVHRNLGPGLFEETYEVCLCREFDLQGINYRRQVSLPVEYKGELIDTGFRIDILVESTVVLELKAVDELTDAHQAQLLSYLQLGKHWLGFLLNFNTERMTDGIVRRVRG